MYDKSVKEGNFLNRKKLKLSKELWKKKYSNRWLWKSGKKFN